MQRRVLFLTKKSHAAQRNRVSVLSEAMHERRWQCTSREEPMFPSYDIIWVMDPSLIHGIGETKCRLLVWDRNACHDDSPLLDEIAMVTVDETGVSTNHTHITDDELHRMVALELAEEVSDVLGGLE